jgi:FdhD protein
MKYSVHLPVIRIKDGAVQSITDCLAVEEPLEIRLAWGPAASRNVHQLAVTMRTPGNDAELAAGFLFTEGIITEPAAIDTIEYVFVPCKENKENIIQVNLKETVEPHLAHQERNFYTTSSCGVCGKASIDAIYTSSTVCMQHWSSPPVAADIINSLPGKLNGPQEIFSATGGLHAATLFTEAGNLLLLREDVGRHNAMDKLIGAAISKPGIDLSCSILLLSGRASFELVQKAAMAGIPVIAAVGAPSSLAVSLADRFGITLIGFLRNERFNIYSAAHRIQLPVYENTY